MEKDQVIKKLDLTLNARIVSQLEKEFKKPIGLVVTSEAFDILKIAKVIAICDNGGAPVRERDLAAALDTLDKWLEEGGDTNEFVLQLVEQLQEKGFFHKGVNLREIQALEMAQTLESLKG